MLDNPKLFPKYIERGMLCADVLVNIYSFKSIAGFYGFISLGMATGSLRK